MHFLKSARVWQKQMTYARGSGNVFPGFQFVCQLVSGSAGSRTALPGSIVLGCN